VSHAAGSRGLTLPTSDRALEQNTPCFMIL
jgi:hypothetical protein